VKVLYPFVGDSVGGSHISTIELYLEMKKKGHNPVIVLHYPNGQLSDYLQKRGIPYLNIETRYLPLANGKLINIIKSLLWNYRNFSEFLKLNRIDIIHCNDIRMNILWSLISKLNKTSFIWHQRQLFTSSKRWKLLPRLADSVIAISHFVKESTPNYLDSNLINVIYNPFTNNFYNKEDARNLIRREYDIHYKAKILAYVGRIEEWKQPHILIRQYAKFISSKEFDNSKLLIVGTGKTEFIKELKKIVLELGIQDNIIFTGFQNKPDRIIAGSDAIICPSNNEPFGRVLIESMLQKTIVIANNSGCHREIITDSINGYLIDINNQKDFSNRLKGIFLEPLKTQKIITKAHNYARKNYSAKLHFDRVFELYCEAIK